MNLAGSLENSFEKIQLEVEEILHSYGSKFCTATE